MREKIIDMAKQNRQRDIRNIIATLRKVVFFPPIINQDVPQVIEYTADVRRIHSRPMRTKLRRVV